MRDIVYTFLLSTMRNKSLSPCIRFFSYERTVGYETGGE